MSINALEAVARVAESLGLLVSLTESGNFRISWEVLDIDGDYISHRALIYRDSEGWRVRYSPVLESDGNLVDAWQDYRAYNSAVEAVGHIAR